MYCDSSLTFCANKDSPRLIYPHTVCQIYEGLQVLHTLAYVTAQQPKYQIYISGGLTYASSAPGIV